MYFALIKTLHVLAAVLFLGTGIGSVYYKLRAHRSGDLAAIAFCDREVVRADWWFTVPAGLTLPATGYLLVGVYHLPWTTPWIVVGLVGYTLAGLTWLPAAFLQIHMRTLSRAAVHASAALPPAYHRALRAWMLLGIPSFVAAMTVVWAMVAKGAMLGAP
jgi:uncharacterized membrane protein